MRGIKPSTAPRAARQADLVAGSRPQSPGFHISGAPDPLRGPLILPAYRQCFFVNPPTKQNSGVTLAVFHDPDGLGITIQQR